jgi:hypothetical protein
MTLSRITRGIVEAALILGLMVGVAVAMNPAAASADEGYWSDEEEELTNFSCTSHARLSGSSTGGCSGSANCNATQYWTNLCKLDCFIVVDDQQVKESGLTCMLADPE